jgi:hypothetical protein
LIIVDGKTSVVGESDGFALVTTMGSALGSVLLSELGYTGIGDVVVSTGKEQTLLLSLLCHFKANEF